MERVAILIGVARVGTLPVLQAVLPAISHVAGWARRQDFADVVELTDEHRPLQIREVQDVVTETVRVGTVDQVVIYFAGHGVNIGRSEYWLLSDAPRYANEAVSVAGSAHLAEASGIPHVVFVSDACRTAAEGIQMQSLTGSAIFPNDNDAVVSSSVDRFFSCALGSPSLEVRTPEASAGRYRAIYTDALADALNGYSECVLDRDGSVALVRPWPLRDHLEDEVGRRLARMMPSENLVQIPDARITSRPTAWLSRLREVPSPLQDKRGDASGTVSLPSVVRAAMHEHLSSQIPGPAPILEAAADLGVAGASSLLAAVRRVADSFNSGEFFLASSVDLDTVPDSSFPLGGQVAVRGALIQRMPDRRDSRPQFRMDWGRGGWGHLRGRRPRQFAIRNFSDSLPVEAIAEFSNGTSVALPVFPGFRTEVTLEEDEVVDVAFERIGLPVDRSRRVLRALVSCASRMGVFSVDAADADLLNLPDEYGNLDPALAVFAAYGHWRTVRRRQSDIESVIGQQMRGVPADLGLSSSARGVVDRRERTRFPLLAEGWPILATSRRGRFNRLSQPLVDELRTQLAPSMWTQFTPAGTQLLKQGLPMLQFEESA